MIIEIIISSVNENGQVNFAPIGVHLPDHRIALADIQEFELQIYRGSQTFSNLKTTGEGVVNFTEDSMAFVETALFSQDLKSVSSRFVRSPRMLTARAIWEFSVLSFDDHTEPAQVQGKVLHYEELAGYPGFCRAQGVVLEAAIMATRLRFIPKERIEQAWPLWQEVVEKTGGNRELEALRRVNDYLFQNGVCIKNI